MIKELFLTASALTSMGVPVRSSQVRSNEQETTIEEEGYSVIENGMKITYKYQSNEVTSSEDLIEGNVYKFNINFSSISELIGDDRYIFFQLLSDLPVTQTSLQAEDLTNDIPFFAKNLFLTLQFYSDESSIFTYFSEEQYFNNDYSTFYTYNDIFNIEFIYIRFLGSNSTIVYEYFEESDYNEIVSVERVYPTNLMGNIAQFIDDYLLSGIPLIDSVTGSINGTNVTMRSWLCSMICIVIACLLIWLAIIFIKWMFKLISGCFNRL